jgi:hypothetical protein
LDDEEAKKKEQEEQEDEFFDAEDDFFKEYRAKLMHQMQQRLLNTYVFFCCEYTKFDKSILVLVLVNKAI